MFQKWHCFGMFWRCLRTCCIYPSRTRIAQPSGHFLGQVAVQNRPQRRLQDILAALRVRVTDFGPRVPKGSGSECPILVAQMPSNAHQKVEYWIPWLLSLFLLALPKYVETGIAPNAKNTTTVWLNQNARSHYMGPDWPAPLWDPSTRGASTPSACTSCGRVWLQWSAGGSCPSWRSAVIYLSNCLKSLLRDDNSGGFEHMVRVWIMYYLRFRADFRYITAWYIIYWMHLMLKYVEALPGALELKLFFCGGNASFDSNSPCSPPDPCWYDGLL